MANRSNVPRKEKQWGSLGGQQFDLTADGTSSSVVSLSFTSSQTILRMIGHVLVSATGTIVADDSVIVTLGLAKVSTDAAAVGSTAMSDPAQEPEFPWLFWLSIPVRWPEGGSPVQGRELPGVFRREFDIRTMRKFKPRESLVWVLEYSNTGGNPPVTVSLGDTRILLTIH